jgi:hypothetical protein
VIEILTTPPSAQHRTPGRLRGHMVRIEGVPFLSLRAVEPEEAEWMFFSYELADGELLSVRALAEKAFPPQQGAAQLQELLRQNLERAEIYTEATTYRRAPAL